MADWQTSQEAGLNEIEALRQARKDMPTGRELQNLMKRSGIRALSIGFRERKARRKREIAIRIHIAKKIALDDLRPNQKLPTVFGSGPIRTPVDVLEEGVCQPCMAKSSPAFPVLKTGSLIGPDLENGGWGTMGLVVETDKNREERLLTNAHVVTADRKITDVRQQGQSMLQPPVGSELPHDDARTIGTLVKDTLTFNGTIDAALIRPDPSLPSEHIGDNDGLRAGELTELDQLRRTRVKVTGAASSLASASPRTGRVESIFFLTPVSGVTFRDQILVEPDDSEFVIDGDSGSALVKGTKVVGLIHSRVQRPVIVDGTTVLKWFGVACPINEVLSSFSVTLP